MLHFYYLQIESPKGEAGDYSRIIEMAGVILLLLIIGFFLLLIFARQRQNQLVLKQQAMQKEFQQQFLQSQVEIQEATFLAIGKELHDNIGQLLSSSRMLLGVTERSLQNPPETLLNANAALGRAINEVRSLSKSLDKEWLERFNFYDNLKTEIVRISSNDTIHLTYSLDAKINLGADKQLILFRIVQEAVQNVIKHAQASELTIRTQSVENKISITITDNGTGFDSQKPENGMGLSNMKYRTSLMGGIITWQSSLQKGTTVFIEIPNNETQL